MLYWLSLFFGVCWVSKHPRVRVQQDECRPRVRDGPRPPLRLRLRLSPRPFHPARCPEHDAGIKALWRAGLADPQNDAVLPHPALSRAMFSFMGWYATSFGDMQAPSETYARAGRVLSLSLSLPLSLTFFLPRARGASSLSLARSLARSRSLSCTHSLSPSLPLSCFSLSLSLSRSLILSLPPSLPPSLPSFLPPSLPPFLPSRVHACQ